MSYLKECDYMQGGESMNEFARLLLDLIGKGELVDAVNFYIRCKAIATVSEPFSVMFICLGIMAMVVKILILAKEDSNG